MKTLNRIGFTLIEMMIVMVIAGVLMTIALPGAAQLQRAMKMDSGAQQFMRELTRAQTEAIKRNQARTVTKVSETTYQVQGMAVTTLPEGVKFSASSATSVQFAAFGPPPLGGAVFRLQLDNLSRNVSVNASGLVTVQ
jgi:prepilin-type N-terminal cleavage/methylation domain-containing protein